MAHVRVILVSTLFGNLSRSDLRDAARLAIQSAVAAAAMYSIMRLTGMPEKFVGVLSAVLVVEPVVGTTMSKAWNRFAATLVGCAIGLASLLLMPDGYGTAVALAISMLAMHAVAGFRPQWRYGVVAAVGLALGSENQMFQTAIDRSLAIGLGVAVGVVVSIVVWGERASTRAQRHIRHALESLSAYIDETISSVQTEEPRDLRDARNRYQKHIASARELAEAVRIADNQYLWDQIDAIESMYGAILILERVGGETEDVGKISDEFRRQVESVRTNSCEITEGLAKGELDHEDRMDAIDRAIERIEGQIRAERNDQHGNVFRNTLAYGVTEIEQASRVLIDFYTRADAKT